MTRIRAVLAATMALIAVVAVGVPAGGQGIPGLAPGGSLAGDPYGLSYYGGLQPITAADTPGLLDSTFTLSDVHLTSGALVSPHAATPLTTQYSAQLDMLATQQLAIDAADLARRARESEEAKKREARRSGIAVERAPNPGTPEEWELESFSGNCHPDNTRWRARTQVVMMFERMCADAAADGVTIRLESAYRSPARQKQLFDQAVAKYGSASAARKWVAYSDGTTCTSRHCSGAALDLDLDPPGARAWLHAPVGCYDPATGPRLGESGCANTTLKRVNLYGFALPMDYEPWHVEVGIPLTSSRSPANCDPNGSLSVPEMIGAIWRCKLTAAGIVGAHQDRVVAEAVTVAEAESGFNTYAVAFGGRWLHTPHPDGNIYSAAGVFQFIRSTADRYIDGGYGNVHDPVANISAAADLWIDGYQAGRDPWSPWEAAAVNGNFATESVLPGYPGGPDQLPTWAWQY